MPIHELLAILPNTQTQAPRDDLMFVTQDDFTALVRKSPHRGIVLPRSRKASFAQAAERQEMLEATMCLGPLIVVRPEFYATPSQIEDLIRANAPQLHQLCSRFANLTQYQITVRWTPSGVMERFRQAPELGRLFSIAKPNANDLHQAVAALAHRLGTQMIAALDSIAAEILTLPLDRDVLANVAVLLPEDATQQLDAAVAGIDAIWTEGLHIKQIGPAPAVSFALLHPKAIAPEDIHRAKANLHLSEHPSISAARHEALRAAPHKAELTKYNARILSANARLETNTEGFYLCDVLSEDRANTDLIKDVA